MKKTAAERHRLGQMSPYVNQVLNKGEIKLPVLLEGENFSQVPPAHDVFRPLRQNIYAVLFNLHHARFTKKSNDEAGTGAILIPAFYNSTHYSTLLAYTFLGLCTV